MPPIINNVSEYIANLPIERKAAIEQLRAVILKNLPDGFEEIICYGMITYVIPHSTYPKGYYCDPKQALPFLSIASQKNFISIYHMGMYANPDLYEWFVSTYPKYSNLKLDMGKSCIRFKKVEAIPFDLIGELASKVTVNDWIATYESTYVK